MMDGKPLRERCDVDETGFEFEGFWVTDPEWDVTGRFEVDPRVEYGDVYLAWLDYTRNK